MIAVEQKEAPVSLDLETPPSYSPRPNAVTLAAAREARDIMNGKTHVDWNSPPATKEDLKAQLRNET
ncbi:MAG: hypothetical protein FWB99_09590 [Treponema sp.]|nr:hypothetical protein [Treponema sp.]